MGYKATNHFLIGGLLKNLSIIDHEIRPSPLFCQIGYFREKMNVLVYSALNHFDWFFQDISKPKRVNV